MCAAGVPPFIPSPLSQEARDAAGRLVGLTQWNNPTNGFFWTAVYDALGRRLRTTFVPVVNGYTNTVGTLTLDSYFDPQVEFEEVGVAVNGQRTWKVQGPDMDGHYGSLQGVGGLEATVRESDGLTTPVLNDYFGNVLATLSGSTTSWNPVRVGGYGPVLGYQSPTLTASTPLADTLLWRSRGIDPSGFYNLGTRYYDPVAGHFLSADPLGHAASMDLHSFCLGDPINRFDPTGRFGKGNFQEGVQRLQSAGALASEGVRQFDLAHEEQIQGIAIDVIDTAVLIALPEVAAGLLEEGLGVEAGVSLEESEAVGAQTARSEGMFTASGQGEFAFARELEAASEVERGAALAEAEAPTAAETALGASQGEQLELALGEPTAAARTSVSEIESGASQISQSESTPFERGIAFENNGVSVANDQAFQQDQMVRRLSVRAFSDANRNNLLEGRTVIDAAGVRLDNGEFGALEFKLSEDAPLTQRQSEHFPNLQLYGGVVVGKNGEVLRLPAGSALQPFQINRINGPQLPAPGNWWKIQ